jgi:hypothetical protein
MGFLDIFKNKKPSYDNNLGKNLRSTFLTVDSAYPGDQGLGKIRLEPETMLILKVSPGDIVEVEGKRRTVATIWRSLVQDWNTRKARLDKFTCFNAGVKIGDTIKISKIVSKIEATKIILVIPKSLQEKIKFKTDREIVNTFDNFPAMKDDIIPLTVGLSLVKRQLFGLKVVDIKPENANIITKKTIITFLDTFIDESDSLVYSFYEKNNELNTFDVSHPDSANVYNITPSNDENRREDPLNILKIRLAKGEISKDEYEELKKTLES